MVKQYESERSFHTERVEDMATLARFSGYARVLTESYKSPTGRYVKYLVLQFTAENQNSTHNYPAIHTQQHGLSIFEAASLGEQLVDAAERAAIYNKDQPDAHT